MLPGVRACAGPLRIRASMARTRANQNYCQEQHEGAVWTLRYGSASQRQLHPCLKRKLARFNDIACNITRQVRLCCGRLIRKSPSTSASIWVRKKQSIASSGRQTIGSVSLNEVFSTTGTPVKSRKAEISA